MDYLRLHDWDVSPSRAAEIQKELRSRLRIAPFHPKNLRRIAGADISFNRYSDTVYASFVILDASTMKVIDSADAVVEVKFPYIPGYLSFREIPPLLKAWEKLKIAPDVIVMDGQGIAHPRRMGIAAHIGLLVDLPTFGVREVAPDRNLSRA